jgi:hypothetical protein
MGIWAWEVGRDTHPGVAEAIEDVNFTHGGGGWSVGHCLQHRVCKGGKDVVDLCEEKRKETVVAVAEDGEEGHELVEVVAGAESEGVRVSREER